MHHIQKGWRVLGFRGWQEVRLAWMRCTRGWHRVERAAARVAERESTRWLESLRTHPGVVHPHGRKAFQTWAREHPAWAADLEQRVHEMAAGRFEVFDHPAAFALERMPWSEDWRFGWRWKPQYFREYDFYQEGKDTPYDVKWPWELSRLSWLVPLIEAAALTDSGVQHLALRLLRDWEDGNPVAWSVNWMPMEASIRGVFLTLSAGMLAADPATTPELMEPWLRLGVMHGAFVSRTVEWTDVNNNHYIANLAALAMLGRALAPVHRPAAAWHRFGERRLWREILTQFHLDGVNYEMATGYHRLVTELCLLSAVCAERAGAAPPDAVWERLAGAVGYAAAYTRPDGWAPAVGDNDSSRVLAFDGRHTRDHGELIALGVARCGVPLPSIAGESAAVPWLLGAPAAGVGGAETPLLLRFPASGIVIARRRGNYLYADLGEVGLRGRGGHGHNDALGFELSLGGEPVFVDPGTPCYTGDLERHRQARATASHNVVRVDEQEQAPLVGAWRIGSDAAVRDLRAAVEGDEVVIAGEHAGYARLADPVVHRRTWRFEAGRGRLLVLDHITCRGAHRVERFLHLAPGAVIEMDYGAVIVRLRRGTVVRCRWWPEAGARLTDGWAADSYGSERRSEILVLETPVAGSTELSLLVELDPRTSRS
jgi:hypothetical protein